MKKMSTGVWLALAGVAIVAVAIYKQRQKATPTNAATTLSGLTGLLSNVSGWFAPAKPTASSSTIVEIPTGGNTLPGSPVFGPELPDGSLFTT